MYVCICFFFRIQKSKKAETIYFQFHWYLFYFGGGEIASFLYKSTFPVAYLNVFCTWHVLIALIKNENLLNNAWAISKPKCLRQHLSTFSYKWEFNDAQCEFNYPTVGVMTCLPHSPVSAIKHQY